MPEFFSSTGERLRLGHELGRGGEGSVFELAAGKVGFVAKMYNPGHGPPPGKLDTMMRMCNERLRRIAAWPVATIRGGPTGAVLGFVMDRIADHQPIHNLYNPRSRKERFPQADWAFLVLAARNVAAAFAVMHANGIVVGDVNHGNLLVGKDATVKLIDCDSFQVADGGKLFRCTVGVSHFTPPELQGVDFSTVTRTQNHDNFGLGLLIFHLLFMGRHPYAGMYQDAGDVTLERAIREFRYAYASDSAKRRVSRPPHSPGTDMLPATIREYLDRSFTELGTRGGGRPAAADWWRALGELRDGLHACSRSRVHRFAGTAIACPWCKLEMDAGVVLFVDGALVGNPDPLRVAFDLNGLWQRIQAIQPPPQAPPVSPDSYQKTPSPYPGRVKTLARLGYAGRVAIAVLAVILAVSVPSVWWLWLVIGFIAFWFVRPGAARDAENHRRTQALKAAEAKWLEFCQRWPAQLACDQFLRKKAELEYRRKVYQGLRGRYESERRKLQDAARERQLNKFLDQFSLDRAQIQDIGPSRRATLVSFGIESAADVTYVNVSQVSGFGPVLTERLLAWRKRLEQRFTFDPARAVDPADTAALNRKFEAERLALESALRAGPEVLAVLGTGAQRAVEGLRPEMETLAAALAQARADSKSG